MLGTDICCDLFHALGGCECHRTAPHILVVQGQRHHMRPLNHALAEHLQQNLGTPVLRVHIVGTRILRMREFTAGRHEQDLHIGRRNGLNCTRNIIHSEVGGDKPHDDGGTARHIVEFAQALCCQLTPRKICRLHVAAPHGAESCKRSTGLRRLRLRGRFYDKGLRLDVIRG